MLLGEDLEAAEVQALDYALGLVGKNETMARQMVLHARTLFWERCSWQPEKCPLGAFLCGIVRTEWSNEARRGVLERKNEVEYLTEVDTLDGSDARSPEELLVEHEQSEEGRQQAAREIGKLEAHFVEVGDEVNVDWIKHSLAGIDDPARMAELSGRRVEEFYRARDRRVRYVQRLLQEKK